MDNNWKDKLTPEVYAICWNKKTEPAFSGKYNNHKEVGSYHCICCDNLLFSSNSKFDSGSGWPSFTETANNDSVDDKNDYSFGMYRVEVLCRNCGAHLGHVFDDGPNGKQRYCINSLSLNFKNNSNIV